jgi:hypothetical protein
VILEEPGKLHPGFVVPVDIRLQKHEKGTAVYPLDLVPFDGHIKGNISTGAAPT